MEEECSLLHVPAITRRDTMERPERIESGSNLLYSVEQPDPRLACVRAVIDGPRDGISPYALTAAWRLGLGRALWNGIAL